MCNGSIFTLFVVLADLDDLIDVLLLESSSNDNEIILRLSASRLQNRDNTYLFLEWIAEVDDGLLLDQPLRKPCLALFAPRSSRRLDLLKAGDGRTTR